MHHTLWRLSYGIQDQPCSTERIPYTTITHIIQPCLPYVLTTLANEVAAPCLTDGMLSQRLLKNSSYKVSRDALQ
jgi:hypothetical protein